MKKIFKRLSAVLAVAALVLCVGVFAAPMTQKIDTRAKADMASPVPVPDSMLYDYEFLSYQGEKYRVVPFPSISYMVGMGDFEFTFYLCVDVLDQAFVYEGPFFVRRSFRGFSSTSYPMFTDEVQLLDNVENGVLSVSLPYVSSNTSFTGLEISVNLHLSSLLDSVGSLSFFRNTVTAENTYDYRFNYLIENAGSVTAIFKHVEDSTYLKNAECFSVGQWRLLPYNASTTAAISQSICHFAFGAKPQGYTQEQYESYGRYQYELGETVGSNSGYTRGYEKGLVDGINSVSGSDLAQGVKGFVFSLFDAPVNTFMSVFNFSYDGFNIGSLAALVLTAAVVIGVVKILS